MPPTVLFVTHGKKKCGVYEFGKNVFNAVKVSSLFHFVHLECDSLQDLVSGIDAHKPGVVIYNYHPSVMPWLCTKVSKGLYRNNITQINAIQVGVIHEITQGVADAATAYRNKYVLGSSAKRLNSLFDYYIAADPSLLLKNPFVFKTGRLLPAYTPTPVSNPVFTIGSFGFATPNKGFENLARKVKSEFDKAVIRLNIPPADFGDPEGKAAAGIEQSCRQILAGTGIELHVSHDYLSDKDILDFLAGNDMNVFLYEDRKGRGISSATDYAIASRRPVAVSDCLMFRHLLSRFPFINAEKKSLKEIHALGFTPFENLISEWDAETMKWEYERILKAVLGLSKAEKRPVTGIRNTVEHILNKTLTRPGRSFSWLNSTEAATPDNLEKDPQARYQPVELSGNDGFNRILDDAARSLYMPAVKKLFEFAPGTMRKKIERANVQQAFVFDTVYRHIPQYDHPRLLCVGSYEDTASMALQKLGYQVEEIDPMINYFLQDYVTKPGVKHHAFDIIFSTSVIEHDPDDESFIRCIDQLLAPGGMAVITCDYKDGWKPGDPKPEVDARFYTKSDLDTRLLAHVPGCRLVDQPRWECPDPDFFYLNKYRYTFATFTIVKNK